MSLLFTSEISKAHLPRTTTSAFETSCSIENASKDLQEILRQFLSPPHAAPLAMYHNNVVNHHGGKTFNVSSPHRFQPSLPHGPDARL